MTDATTLRPRAIGRWGWLFLALLGLSSAGFAALGIWQVQRLSWKTDLIERVEARTRAQPVAVPAPALWPTVNAAAHEYLRVQLQGQWKQTPAGGKPADIWVRTGSELGWGYWLMSPLQTSEGFWVIVNRGFVPAEQRSAVAAQMQNTVQAAAPGDVRITGLLRMSEASRLLRANDLEQGRWAARDVPVMAQAMGLGAGQVAPFFVDASAETATTATARPEWPRPGLTVVRFSNNHLSYALTWFALAALCAGGCWLLLRARNS
ncbi:SURF1 family protein [Variovorax sp. VNK109]|uniref:SURF1 family protein n=1 Tax=Variovorax sp. VNK109 TaxID=3400919 RepID=UPI003C07A9D5